MGIRINTNTTAVNAFNNLSRATNKLSTSVERLSSGLRINHAQDDPAGLAIAEKIRTQVKGLARASMNAQDGVSLLQTAEGALGEIQNMLQRIRELAVQAANGTLTSNDRVEIQREVDQLLDEVDRTSIATEFNTKKLLDGKLSALTSVDDAALTPIITGDKVHEGNFRIEASMNPGQAEVLKTDIFRIVAGEQYADGVRGLAGDIDDGDTDTGGTALETGVGAAGGGAAVANTLHDTSVPETTPLGRIEFDASDFTLWQNIDWSVQPDVTNAPGSPNTSQDFVIEYATAGAVDWQGVIDAKIAGTYTGFTHDLAGLTEDATMYETPYISIEVVGVRGTTDAAKASVTDGTMNVDAATFANGEQLVELKVTAHRTDGTVALQESAEFTTVALETAGGGTDVFGILDGAGTVWDGSSTIMFTDGDNVSVGDKVLLLNDYATPLPNGYVYAGQDKTAMGLNDNDGSVMLNNVAGINIGDPAAGNEINRIGARVAASGTATAMAGTTVHTTLGWIDNSGDVQIGGGDFRFGDGNWTTRAGGISFNLQESTLAERVTELQYVDRFQTSSSMFDLYAQPLTMYSNGESTDIILQAKDSLEDVAEKFRMAITSSVAAGGLGMGVDGDISTRHGIDFNTAIFVSDATGKENTDEAVAGTMVIRSTTPGLDGRFFFSGDERLINGLSLATVKEATLNSMDVDVFDAHTGEKVGQATVNDGVLRGVLDGVEVGIDQGSDVRVIFDTVEDDLTTAPATDPTDGIQGGYQFRFESDFGKKIAHIHVVDNSLTLQIGANPGQTLDAIVGQVDREGLELDNLLVVDRQVAEEAIVRVDRAINGVSSQRARIGAYINRLNTTMNILDITGENLTAAESRIRDLDVAQQTITFTRDQMLVQAATAMLAQANTLPQSVLTLLR
jgi:flagellin